MLFDNEIGLKFKINDFLYNLSDEDVYKPVYEIFPHISSSNFLIKYISDTGVEKSLVYGKDVVKSNLDRGIWEIVA